MLENLELSYKVKVPKLMDTLFQLAFYEEKVFENGNCRKNSKMIPDAQECD